MKLQLSKFRRSNMSELGKYFNQYRKIRLAAGISKPTLDSEYNCHKKLWKFLKAKGELSITKTQILSYARHITSNPSYTDNTKHQRIKGLSSFYNEALKQQWILVNPMAGMRYPKRTQVLPKVLSIKQMKQLLNLPDLGTLKGIRDRTIFELAYSCGLRAREILLIRDNMFYEDYTRLRIIGKGNKEAILPVGRMAAYFLRFYVKHVWPRLQKHNLPELFLSCTTGKPLWDSALRNIYAKYGRKINLKISPHMIRYSICSHLSDEGVDIRLIQEFMRHDSIETTARYIRQDFHKMQAVHKQAHPRERA